MASASKGSKTHVKLACLECRASKTRCDGKKPCASCNNNQRECIYRPSRRGGARWRGTRVSENLNLTRSDTSTSSNEKDTNQRYDSLPQSQSQPQRHAASTPPPQLAMTGLSVRVADPSLLGSSIGLTPQPTRNPSETPVCSPMQAHAAPSPQIAIPKSSACPTVVLRAYQCEKDLINAYYIFVHPYFPVLPPPPVSQHEDRPIALKIWSTQPDLSNLPVSHSPLGLALSALLVLIPPPDDSRAMERRATTLRRAYAELYVRSALESLENGPEPSEILCTAPKSGKGQTWVEQPSSLHPNLPLRMEPVTTLCLLGIYEYCQRSSVAKMRIRVNQALTTAMDLGLHQQEESATKCSDSQRRVWWLTIFLVYLSSILHASPPLITIDDSRINTPFPTFCGCREPFPLLMKAQEILLRSCCIAGQLIRDTNTRLPGSLGEDILKLDSSILDLAANADRFRCVTNQQGTEADASRTLWAISRALIHTARLELHRFRAFMGDALLLGGHCEFTSTSTASCLQPPRRLTASRMADIHSVFPFSEHDSARICLKSALTVSRIFRHLVSPNPSYSNNAPTGYELAINPSSSPLGFPRSLPYMAFCELQSFYVLIMLLRRVRTAMCCGDVSRYYYMLGHPDPATEVGDAERLIEELRQGVNALSASIRADATFEHVQAMAREIEEVYETTFLVGH